MGAIESHNIYGLTIRESATDGSDFTNPGADYRRLFLGEDGQLHVKDSAGAVTDIGGAISEITDIPTAETTATKVLAPDGAGGVEWRDEAGGSVATDAIWDAAGDLAVGSGANTAAKLAKGNAGGLLAMSNGALVWNAGTSFPASPATGDLYHRTDLSPALWRFDGTRWLCTCLHEITFNNFESLGAQSDTGADQTVYRGAVSLEYARWMVDLVCTTYVATNNGSNYWTVTLARADAANSTTTVTSFTTAADTQANWVEHRVAIDALLNSTARLMKVTIRDTGSPGGIYLAAGYSYLHAIVP